MTLKKYLYSMALITAILWGLSIIIILNIDPETSGMVWKFLFYASLFMSFSGLLSLVGFLIRAKANPQHLPFYSVRNSFRQAFIFSFLLVALLFLSSQKLFSWFNALLLLAMAVTGEYLLSGNFKKNK